MKKLLFILTTLTLLSLSWGGALKAQQSLPYSYGFEDNDLSVDGWTTQNPSGYNAGEFGIYSGAAKTDNYGFRFSSYSGNVNTQYLISPELNATNGGRVQFYYKGSSSYGNETFKVGYSTTDADISSFIFGSEISTNGSTSWTLSDAFAFPAGTKYVAIYYYSNNQYRLYVDDISFMLPASCPKPISISITSSTSSSLNIGWTPAGSETSWNVYLNGALTADSPVSSTSYPFEGLTENNDYTLGVSAICGSEESDLITTTVHLGYCVPAPSSVDGSGITNVTFGTVNDDISMYGQSSYYYDHSSQSGEAYPGGTVDVSIVYATNYNYYTWVWVDWNHDFTFSDDECVWTPSSTILSGTLELSFNVPATVASGDYRMRIQGADGESKKNPCYTGTYSYLVDYTLHIGAAPNCLAPTGLTAINVTHEEATLTWNNPNEGGSYIIKKVVGDEETVIEDNYTTTSYPITGLDPQTNYTYRVYIKCNASDISDPAEVSFSTTAQATAVGDYWSDDFEGASCEWELINGNLTNAWVWGTATSNGGTHSLYISKDGGTSNTYSGDETKVFAAKLLNFTDSKYTFEYDWNCKGEDTWDFLRVALVPASESLTAGTDYGTIRSNSLPTGWIALDGGGQLNQPTSPSTSWQNKTVSINVAAGNYYLVLAWRNDVSAYDPPAAVDNVSITKVACEYLVEGVQVINSTVTTTTANVLWDASEATAWQVQTKAGDGEWTTLASSDVDFSLSGVKEIAYLRNLTPGTEYQIRARANCGNEQYGTWSEAVSFTTECTPRAVTNDNKFTANFDDMTGTTYTTVNILPFCWNYINTCSHASYNVYPYVNSTTGESNSGANHLRFHSYASADYTYYNPKPQYAILPPMQDISNLRIKFYARAYSINNNYDATFKVGVLTNPNDASTFTEIATFTPATTTYELYTIPFNTYSGNGNYIAIMIDAAEVPVSGSFYRMLLVDDITVEPTPTCVEPTDVTVAVNGPNSATISWTDGGNTGTPTYIIKMGDTELDGSATPAVSIEGTTATLTGLTANHNYAAGVFTISTKCSATESSEPVNVYAFNTPCDAQPITYTMGFEAAESGKFDCWEVISGDITIKSGTAHESSYRLDFRGSNSNMIALPQFTEPTNTLRVEFWTRPEDKTYANCGKFAVGYLTDLSDVSTFVPVKIYNYNDWSSNTYEKKTVDFNEVPADANIALRQYDCATSYYWYVDDITVMPIPECVVPTNLRTVSVAHDGATVKWAANLEESWNLKYHAQGENQWIEVNGLQDSTYTFTELNAETEYEWQVQAACGANLTSDWSSLGTFTTEAEPQVTCHEWQLVTSANDLHDGDQIIIAASGNYNVAMSTTQKDNNRDVATIIKDGNKLTLPVGNDVQVLTANYLATNDAWTLYTGEGYLYAASSSSNYLRTEEGIDDDGNAYWTITFSNGVASIVAKGNNTRNIMKYNNGSNIISCYASGQSPLAIYRLIDNRRLATKDTIVAHALPFTFTMAGQPDTIITSYGEFNLSYVIEADPVNCDSVLNVHLTVNEPMFTVTLNAGAGTITLPAQLTGNSTHPVDLANLVPELDNNCTEWNFAGWASAAVAETNDAPDFMTTVSPTSDTTLYAVYVKSEGGSGDAAWQKANTIAIDDQMVLVYETGKYELSGISTTNTKYGERVSYSDAPTGVYPLTVVAGSDDGSYSLKTSDNNYLTWTSGNSLNKASSVTDNSSWSISFDNNGNAVIANISNDNRKIRYNTGSPRFACYEDGQSAVQLYKLSNPVVNTYNSNPVCDVNYNITLIQPADGSISSDPEQTASAGTVVKLTATPHAGYTFESWEVRNLATGLTVDVVNDQFTMPAANVEVHASFTAIEYTVTATANPAAGGTITGTGTYSYEGAASLTASADNGYEFVNWTNEQGAVVCTTATYNFIVTRDSALTANFALKEYTITMSVVTGGTLSHNLPANVATMGTEVTLIATPDEGYQFDGDWTVQNISASSPIEVVNNKFRMPAGNVTVIGYFSPITYTVSAVISPDNAGSVSGTGSYNHGAEAQLRANPAAGYEFVNWTNAQGAVVSTDADYNFIVTRDSALTANFELKEYTITMSVVQGGTLSHNLPANVATMGTEVTLIATPDEGYQFDGDWYVQNTSASSPVTVENNKFTMPAGNVTVTGYFSYITYTVSAVVSPANAGSVTGTGSFNHGAEVQLTANPATGYEFVNWTNAQGAVVCTTATYNFNVTSGSALTANFALKEYTITYMDGNTELDVDTFAFGADVTAIADPEKECKEFAGWNETLPTTMPANNIVLYAQWNDLYYNITASADPVNGGSVSFNPEPEVGTTAANSGYLCNTPVTLTATPAQGYTFTGWSVNGQIVSADAEYDIIATQNSTLVATFIMDVPVCEEWQLVTSVNDLQDGDRIIIAASDLNKAMGEQKTNNRGVADINKNTTGNTLELPISDDVQVLTANFVATNNTWTLNTGDGYLYAAGASGNNYLKTEDAVDNNGNANWRITISNNEASIVAQGTATRNTMLCNNQNTNNPIISCYNSSTSGNIYHTLAIYRLADMKAQSDTTAVVLAESFEWRGTTYPASGDYEVLVGTAANGCDSVRVLHLTLQQKVATPTFNPAAGEYAEPQTLTIACATEGATIYYTTDGTEPTPNSTQYTAAITLNADTTVKAIAVKEGDEWVNSDVATAAYTFNFPSYTVTFNPGDNGTVPQATMSGNQYTEPVDFANNVPSPAATCTEWTFAGWSTTPVTGTTTTAPTFVTSPYYPTDNITLYAVYQKTEQGTGTSTPARYVKVTSAPNDWSGDYLIVCEGIAVAFDGGLSTLDAAHNNIEVDINNGVIASNTTTDAAKFTVAQMNTTTGYSIKSASGKYIGNNSNSNGLTASATELSNTLSISGSDCDVKSSGGAYLRYNSSINDDRFRYYKSSSYTNQEAIQLYKYEPATATDVTTYNSNPVCSYMVYVDGNIQNGTVTVDPATATTDGALIGSTVTLTATPNQGYHFGYWQVSTDATYTNPVTVTNNSFEMPTSDVYVNAIFWIDTLHITATVNPAQTGSVDPSEAYVIYGDQVTLTATPAQDYLFENWTSNGQPVATDAVITITATQDSALVANFVQMEQVVTPIFTSNPEGNTFTTEDVVTVTITTTTPNATIYYTMDGTDPVVPAGRNVTGTQVYEGPITLTETTTLKAVAAAENMINSGIATATYTINQMYYVDVDNSIEHGTVTADPEKGIENTQISLTAVPEDGYIFNAWNVYNANDADQTVTVTNNQFNMPAYDVMVSATFVPDTFTVTFVLNGAQFVAGYTPISRYWYKQQDANLPTAADMEYEGHSFDGWYENANFDGNSWTSVPDTAKSNKTYYAKWNVNNYGLTINYVDFNGQTVHESYSQSLDYGTDYAVASPAVDTYMPELDTVKGTMGTEAVTVNVRYAQVQMLNIDNVTVCTGETTQEINYELIPFFMEHFSGMRQGFETVIDGPMSITAGSNGIAAFTAVNDGTEPLTNTITVTPHDTLGGHTVKGVPQTFTITVNPKNVSEFSEIACDSYTWTAADTTIVDEGENDYVHVFQNQYGCDSTVTLHLNLHKTPTVVVAVDKAFYCTTENVTLNSTGSSTGSEYTYAWTGPNNYASTETSPVLASPLTGEMSGTYQLTVTHTATGCVSEPASVEVVVNTPSTPGYLFTITTHGDAYANIDGSMDEVTPVFATPEVNHFLDGANVNYTVVNNAENSYNAVGDYTITWTATDECGNEATTTQVLHVTQNVCPVATDADNNTYPSVQLAGKCWMAKNLRTTKYSDSRAVNNLMVYDNIMYPNTTENLDRYGYLYDWNAAMDAENGLTLDANNNVQGICPTGWHMPNGEDFMSIAGTSTATDMFDLRYNHYWLDGGGNNSTNYSLLPGGCYNENAGRYENLIGNAYLWGVNAANPTQPRVYWADCKCYMWQVNDVTGGMGYSVRCIKD